jgi:adenylyltransferase/sulfurtransferase
VQLIQGQGRDGLNMDEFAIRMRRRGAVRANEFMIRTTISDNEKTYEITVFRDGRAIVKGTGDTSVARGIYAKYVGN